MYDHPMKGNKVKDQRKTENRKPKTENRNTKISRRNSRKGKIKER
jgi:hypothetical protein